MARFLSSPPNPSAFNALVWELVRKIPPGKVLTYAKVASYIPVPADLLPEDYQASASSWVGKAMARCPEGVPWQRVINAQGKISLPAQAGGRIQRSLLESEGIEFDSHDRIDLTRYLWAGPKA